MPELPEVETIKLGLERRIAGLEVAKIETRMAGMLKGDGKRAEGKKVVGIRRRAKVLIIDLSDNISLMIHLKMTGQLVFQSFDEKIKVVGGHPQAEYNQPLPHRHTHVIISFSDGSHLYFNDLRRFGWMLVLGSEEVAQQANFRDSGPEPFGEGYQDNVKAQMPNFKEKMAKRKNLTIKQLLMDQKFIAGIGNIYSDEILYAAKVRPDRKVGTLSEKEIDQVFGEIPKVLKRALEFGGTSDSTYIGVDGERGDYLQHAFVYHQKKDPLGHKVIEKKIGGRTAHFCEICQK